ncbi:MAG: YcaO-like family protein [Pseudobdellovibrionaceae bacterium]
MAHAISALSWLYQQDDIQITSKDLTWIQNVFPGWVDVFSKIEINGTSVSGWGADQDPTTALTKSIAECLERYVLHKNKNFLTSNGMAAHTGPEKARLNAGFELLERDLFLCHFYTQTPLAPFAEQNLNAYPWISSAKKFAEDIRFRMTFYRLGPSGAVCTLDCMQSNEPLGYVISSAYKSTVEESLRSSFIESARRAFLLNDKDKINSSPSITALALADFLQIPQPTFGDHGRLALDPNYASQYLNPLFRNLDSGPQMDVVEIHFSDLNIEMIPWCSPHSSPCPFYFARATSTKVQNLFLGQPTNNQLNQERLMQFLNLKNPRASLILAPHPLD